MEVLTSRGTLCSTKPPERRRVFPHLFFLCVTFVLIIYKKDFALDLLYMPSANTISLSREPFLTKDEERERIAVCESEKRYGEKPPGALQAPSNI